jgi:hypothetical protein
VVAVDAGRWWVRLWLCLKKHGSGLGLFWVMWPGLQDHGYFIPYCSKSFVAKWLSGYMTGVKVSGSNLGGNN